VQTPLIDNGATYDLHICTTFGANQATIDSLSSWVMEVYFMESTFPYRNITQKVPVALDPTTADSQCSDIQVVTGFPVGQDTKNRVQMSLENYASLVINLAD
jgi:hypothetical protein